MLCAIVLKHAGASNIFVLDIADKRLDLARKLGFTPVNPANEDLEKIVKEATAGEGADVFFECSGAPSAAMQMTDITRVRGHICMVAVHKAPHEVDVYKRQLYQGRALVIFRTGTLYP